MTNEQLKSQIIRDAWVAEIGEEKYNERKHLIDVFGWMQQSDAHWDTWCGDFELHLSKHRPSILSGIEDFVKWNNGWVKIEQDGSNLPTENDTHEYYLFDLFFKENLGQENYTIPYGKKIFTAKGVNEFFRQKMITHYRPIEKHNPPKI
jgi:hypothetical protein